MDLKKNVRVMGIDDARFEFTDEQTLVVAVVVRTPGYIESVLSTDVEVDGNDSTEKISGMLENSKQNKQLKAIMLDGASVGGFNIIDTEALYSKFKIPIISVTRDKPDFEAIRTALHDHFDDWEHRWELITNGELFEISTSHTPIYIKATGITRQTATELIRLTIIRGVLPEPLRLAHVIASGVGPRGSGIRTWNR